MLAVTFDLPCLSNAFHSTVVLTYSNLRRNLEEESYVSALDPDYGQMSDGVSRLGFGFGAEEDDDDFDLRHGHCYR